MTRREACSILGKFAKEHGLQALADEIGCSKAFASLLSRGRRSAGHANALTIQTKFNIPQRVWLKKRSAA
jgi:hypothetical protein